MPIIFLSAIAGPVASEEFSLDRVPAFEDQNSPIEMDENSLTSLIEKIDEVSRLEVLPPDSKVAVKKKKKRKRKKRKGKKRRKRRSKKRLRLKQHVKANVGLFRGSSSDLAFGAEYVVPYREYFGDGKDDRILISGGLTLFSSGEASVTQFEAGGDYLFPHDKKMDFFAGVKLSYTNVRVTVAGASASDSGLHLSPYGGINYKLESGARIGAEFKLPMTDKLDGHFLTAFYRYYF